MASFVVVNKHNVKHNIVHPDNPRPVLSLYSGNKRVQHGNTIKVVSNDGRVMGKFVYRPERPKGCGASVWFEVDGNSASFEIENPAESEEDICNVSR